MNHMISLILALLIACHDNKFPKNIVILMKVKLCPHIDNENDQPTQLLSRICMYLSHAYMLDIGLLWFVCVFLFNM